MTRPAVSGPLDRYIEGAYAPIETEIDVAELRVLEGDVPDELAGAYFRNGPNPRFDPPGRHHWFDGDGMIHAVSFRDGKASYRNRYVRTAGLAEEEAAGRALWRGVMDPPRRDRPDMPLKDTANTDVAMHGGRLVANWYLCGRSYALDPTTLATRGPLDAPFRISAHPKVDPVSGEMMIFGYGVEAPYMHHGVLGADGKLTHATPIDLPGPRLPHDMAITERFSILHDLSLFHDAEALKAGRHKLRFHPEIATRFGILPRHGDGGAIRWFEVEPCFLYHVVNAWEEGERVIMVGCRYEPPRDAQGAIDCERFAAMIAGLEMDARLYRWEFDLATGTANEFYLDPKINAEFPCVDPARVGRPTRYGFAMLCRNRPAFYHPGLLKYDLDTGQSEAWTTSGLMFSEAQFVPHPDAVREDEGWLVTLAVRSRDLGSEVQVFEARDLALGPVVRLEIPQRVPAGFHACWATPQQLGWR